MAPRRSILSVVRDEKAPPSAPVEPGASAPVEPPPTKAASKVKSSRVAKKHLGAYYAPNDPTIKAFQKLGIDLDKDQQEMIFEAISDYVEKHRAASAFE